MTEGEDISDSQIGLFASVDELAGVHAFIGDEGFCAEFVAVGITEDDFGERSTTAGVVDDFLYDSADITMSLSVLHTKLVWELLAEEIHRGL